MGDTFDPVAAGLKVGLEIHQQLGRTGDTKLFCNCPAEIHEGDPDTVIVRQLRASAGETGDVDIAAQAEQRKRKLYAYQAYAWRTCLVEIDEEPPHPVNPEAVKTALMVAKSLKSTIMPKMQFMRKTIVDGSAVSGFQRTGLFAIGGEIPGLASPVRIQMLSLEEDSSKIVERTPTQDVYNLTRLGIPLLEIATAPDITTPEQAKTVAAQIGMILRSTHRVKRGLGTIRQDLNVSVTGGVRNEIKGAQDLRMIPTTIEYEARRQLSLVDIANRLTAPPRISDPIDVTDIFSKSVVPFVAKTLKQGRAIGIGIEGFSGLLGAELCPGHRVGSELADLAKARGFGGIIHSDEDMKKYGVDSTSLAQRFSGSAFLVLLGDPALIEDTLVHAIIPRIMQFASGVPQEVRRANPDGTSSYLRPVPGAARMYPETDVPIVAVDQSSVNAPKLITEQIEDLVKETGLSRDLAQELLDEDIPIVAYRQRFPELTYSFLSSALIEWPRDIAARIGQIADPRAIVEELLPKVADGTIAGSSVKAILERIAQGADPAGALDLVSEYASMPEAEVSAIIKDVLSKNPGKNPKALMGDIMAQIRGRADGKIVMRLLDEQVRA